MMLFKYSNIENCKKVKPTIHIIVVLSIIMLMSACIGQLCSEENELNNIPCDTTSLLTFINSVEMEQRLKVINEPTFLKSGKKRFKGVKVIPQDGDDFRKENLDKVYWRGASVLEGDFRGARFQSADCRDGKYADSDFRFCDVRWADFGNSNMKNCNFSQSALFRLHVKDSDMEGSDFQGSNMFGVIGHRANLRNCDFSNALLKESEFLKADFTGSKAVNVRFIIAVLQGSKLDSTNLSYSDFTGAGLENVSFTDACLVNVTFQGAHLQGADFTGANLEGCNFFAAEFENTIFTNAINIPNQIKELIVDDKITGVCSEVKNNNKK